MRTSNKYNYKYKNKHIRTATLLVTQDSHSTCGKLRQTFLLLQERLPFFVLLVLLPCLALLSFFCYFASKNFVEFFQSIGFGFNVSGFNFKIIIKLH